MSNREPCEARCDTSSFGQQRCAAVCRGLRRSYDQKSSDCRGASG
ncbi:T3SS effector HopA1 family protein [Levyella massiliensis]